MNSAATSKSTRKRATAKGKVVSKSAKSVAQTPKKGKTLSPAAKAAAKAAIPVMADTGAKLTGRVPIKLSRRNNGYSDKSHRTKDRVPLQVSLPPLLVAEMKKVKLLQGVSMVDQIIHCMEMAGYTVDETALTAMSKRYVKD